MTPPSFKSVPRLGVVGVAVRLVVHDRPYLIDLQNRLTGRVSDIVGESVEPGGSMLNTPH